MKNWVDSCRGFWLPPLNMSEIKLWTHGIKQRTAQIDLWAGWQSILTLHQTRKQQISFSKYEILNSCVSVLVWVGKPPIVGIQFPFSRTKIIRYEPNQQKIRVLSCQTIRFLWIDLNNYKSRQLTCGDRHFQTHSNPSRPLSVSQWCHFTKGITDSLIHITAVGGTCHPNIAYSQL